MVHTMFANREGVKVMPKLKRQPPKLCCKKSNDTGFVYVDGRQVYMGKWGEEADENYRRFLAEWATFGSPVQAKERTRIKTLCIAFLDHLVERKLRKSDYQNHARAIKHLLTIYKESFVDEFGPVALKTVRRRMESMPTYSLIKRRRKRYFVNVS